MKFPGSYTTPLFSELQRSGVDCSVDGSGLECSVSNKHLRLEIITEQSTEEQTKLGLSLALDVLVREPVKVAAFIRSKLGLNKKVFARKCDVKKIPGPAAMAFLNQYHLMGGTQSASNYGLFEQGELLAVASFSKGRRMNRLPQNQRSFELIRFCCKDGVTVTGGLSKLLRYFCDEKNAGDVMTYVNLQWSDGHAFVRAGFKTAGQSEAKTFMINRKDFTRLAYPDSLSFSETTHYLTRDAGNLKLVFTP